MPQSNVPFVQAVRFALQCRADFGKDEPSRADAEAVGDGEQVVVRNVSPLSDHRELMRARVRRPGIGAREIGARQVEGRRKFPRADPTARR